MEDSWDCIWVVAVKDSKGHWRKMSKVIGERFHCSAQDAFDALNEIDSDIRKGYGVFEIPICTVHELNSPDEEGASVRK